MEGKEMSEKEAETIIRQISEGKHTVHTFLNNVATAEDTTKVGNLNQEELGLPKLPVRTFKELEVFAREVASEIEWADYFKEMAEVHTSTSLSKDGFLVKAAITTHKTLADVTPGKKKNKGWFKSKDQQQVPPQPQV